MTEAGIIVALDGISEHYALHLAEHLKDIVWGFKVNDLLVQCGHEIVHKLKKFGRVMADPKFFDIPNTVGNGVKRLAEVGADLITCHAFGGSEMLITAVEVAKRANDKTDIVAITVLTSISDSEHLELYNESRQTTVLRAMSRARRAGINHVVCSGKEARDAKREGLTSIVPGVRLVDLVDATIKHDDQQQVTKQLNGNIDYVVIGRPIVAAIDPIAAAILTKDQIHDAYRTHAKCVRS